MGNEVEKDAAKKNSSTLDTLVIGATTKSSVRMAMERFRADFSKWSLCLAQPCALRKPCPLESCIGHLHLAIRKSEANLVLVKHLIST